MFYQFQPHVYTHPHEALTHTDTHTPIHPPNCKVRRTKIQIDDNREGREQHREQVKASIKIKVHHRTPTNAQSTPALFSCSDWSKPKQSENEIKKNEHTVHEKMRSLAPAICLWIHLIWSKMPANANRKTSFDLRFLIHRPHRPKHYIKQDWFYRELKVGNYSF